MHRETKWLGLFILAVLMILAAKYFASFPGDVALERYIQSLLPPSSLNWARWITLTAAFPWSLGLLAITCTLSWSLVGCRAALLCFASFLGMLALGTWLNPVIARPRPSPQLVQVMGSPPGYSFPSSFALTYAATLGFLAILAGLKSKPRRPALALLCSLLLLGGGWARIALGAHWPSDIIISYCLGLLWAAFLLDNFASKT